MSKILKGVIPPIVTPVDEYENVDEKALRKLIDHCIENGIHGIFVTGSNGECMALAQEQRDRAIKITIDEAGGRVPVIAGVMDASTRRTIENIKRFEDMGGENAVVTPVFYARHATQYETVRHFEEISKNTRANLIVYNIPPFTGQTLRAETIFQLAKIDKVIGYKDTSNQMAEFIKCLRHFKGTDFYLFQGSTPLALPSILLGADGYIPSLAPLFPEPFIRLYEAAAAGDIEEAFRWDNAVSDCCSIFQLSRNQTSSTKYAISKLGFLSERVIRPSEPLSEEEIKNLDARLETLRQYMAPCQA